MSFLIHDEMPYPNAFYLLKSHIHISLFRAELHIAEEPLSWQILKVFILFQLSWQKT